MRRVVAAVVIGAAPDRVWQALVDPAEVAAWDGSVPVAVPAGYPQPGQHARWRTRLGPWPVALHDEVQAVDAPRRLASRLRYGFVEVAEEYRLAPAATGGGTVLVADHEVRGRWPGTRALAVGVVRRSGRAALAALARHCERPTAPGLPGT